MNLWPSYTCNVFEDKYIIEKCECIIVKNLKNRLNEANNEKTCSDAHKITSKNHITKLTVYSNSKFGTIRLQTDTVISLAFGVNSYCFCGLRKVQKNITIHRNKI